jgi:hypothetical protein
MKKMPRSLAKYLRVQKSLIRREIFDIEEQKKKIAKLYEHIGRPYSPKKEHTNTKNT